MNKCYLFILTLLLFYSHSYSQTIPDSTHKKVVGIVKIYPTQLPVGELRLGYEMPITHHVSWESSVGFVYAIFPSTIYASDINEAGTTLESDYRGSCLKSGIKLYILNKNDNAGFYWNPLLLGKYYYYRGDNIYTIGFQSLVGYKIPSKRNFSFEIYLGFGFRKIFDNYIGTFEHTTPQAGFSIGYKLSKNKK